MPIQHGNLSGEPVFIDLTSKDHLSETDSTNSLSEGTPTLLDIPATPRDQEPVEATAEETHFRQVKDDQLRVMPVTRITGDGRRMPESFGESLMTSMTPVILVLEPQRRPVQIQWTAPSGTWSCNFRPKHREIPPPAISRSAPRSTHEPHSVPDPRTEPIPRAFAGLRGADPTDHLCEGCLEYGKGGCGRLSHMGERAPWVGNSRGEPLPDARWDQAQRPNHHAAQQYLADSERRIWSARVAEAEHQMWAARAGPLAYGADGRQVTLEDLRRATEGNDSQELIRLIAALDAQRAAESAQKRGAKKDGSHSRK